MNAVFIYSLFGVLRAAFHLTFADANIISAGLVSFSNDHEGFEVMSATLRAERGDERLGERIRAARLRAHLSQTALG